MGVADSTLENFAYMVDTNTRGVWACLRHEIRVMRDHGGGAIVNTGSVSGLVPTAAQAIYGLSKAAVTHLTRSAAAEAGKQANYITGVVLPVDGGFLLYNAGSA